MVNDEDDGGNMVDNTFIKFKFGQKEDNETIWEKHAKETVQDFNTYGSMIEKKFEESEPKPEPQQVKPKEEVKPKEQPAQEPKPVIGHFRENEAPLAAKTDLNTSMIKSTLAANSGNKADPQVQIELAADTSSRDGAVVTEVLENATTDAEEDSAIRQIASQVMTEEDK